MIRVSQFRLPSLLLLAALASGCLSDRKVTAPDSSGEDGSLAIRSESASDARSSTNGNVQYPLTVGNHWRYRSHDYTDVRFVGFPPQVIEDHHYKTTLDLTCEEVVGDTRFVYERITFILSNGSANGTSRYWQNQRGLWREFRVQPPASCEDALMVRGPTPEVSVRDVAQQQVDAAIARNPRRAEIRAAWNRIQAQREAIRRGSTEHLLAFPLHPGRTWRVNGYGTRMTVEALETLHLPIGDVQAWRIRIDYPHQDPSSHTHVWYSDIGMVQYVSHFEGRLVYDDGRIEVYTSESEERLESFQIAEDGPSAVAGETGRMAASPRR